MQNKTIGFSLIEVLIAVVVLIVGVIAIGSLQTHVTKGTTFAEQQAEALTIAHQKLDELRNYTSLTGYQSISSSSSPASILGRNVTFRLTWSVTDSADTTLPYKTIDIRVTWTDQNNITHEVRLTSIIGEFDPTKVI
jgi:type IV pilus modification protein PilV